ncbi:MAG: S41 family peptidase [Pyrinomonadaceae bacterium]
MSKKFGVIAFLLIVFGAVLGGIFGRLPIRSSADNSLSPRSITADYREAVEIIDDKYAGTVDHEKLADASIQSMLWTLDPHSSFFTHEEFRKLYEEQSSRFYGIGVSILQHRDGVYVQSVIPETPADKAGIKFGDRFVEVEGKDARDWTSSEVSRNVRGERGTPVTVKVERVGSKEPVEFTITRGGVPLPSIRNYFMLNNEVGYIGLTGGFQETTSEELHQAINDLKNDGMKSLVLDLRGNPGGLLQQAREVVGQFVPSGQTVVSVKGRTQYSEKEELKTRNPDPESLPLVVMINGGSASASEIVAGAMQDYARGIVVGSDSFGKGLVQKIFQLPYGTGLTLTTARYYTPYGRSLQRDYSSGSIYDYYTQHEDAEESEDGQKTPDAKPKPAGVAVETAGGRVFYGGRGIEPDLKAPPLAYTPLRARINEEAFFFVRQLVAGNVSGFESFRVDRQNYKQTVAPNEFQITDKLLEAFRAFARQDKEGGLSVANINSQIDYAKARLREQLATANNSSEAGQQVLLENDPQVLKAIDAMAEARKLLAMNVAGK